MSGISGDLGGSAAVQKLGAWAQANADGASPDAAARPPYPGTPPLCLLYEDGRKDPVLLPKMFCFATLAIPGLPEQIKEIKAQARQQQPKAKTRDAKAAQAPAPALAVKSKPAAPANPLTEAERTVVKARKHGTQAVCQKWYSRAGWCARCNYAHVCGLCGQDSPAHAAYLCPTRTAPAPEPEREPADP